MFVRQFSFRKWLYMCILFLMVDVFYIWIFLLQFMDDSFFFFFSEISCYYCKR